MKNQTRPTPETDAKWHAGHFVSETMACEFAEKLERERDELREALDTLTLVVGLTPIAGNKDALQEAMNLARTALKAAKP